MHKRTELILLFAPLLTPSCCFYFYWIEPRWVHAYMSNFVSWGTCLSQGNNSFCWQNTFVYTWCHYLEKKNRIFFSQCQALWLHSHAFNLPDSDKFQNILGYKCLCKNTSEMVLKLFYAQYSSMSYIYVFMIWKISNA